MAGVAGGLAAIGAVLGIIAVPIGYMGESLTHDLYGAVIGYFLLVVAMAAGLVGLVAVGSALVLLLVAAVMGAVVFRGNGRATS